MRPFTRWTATAISSAAAALLLAACATNTSTPSPSATPSGATMSAAGVALYLCPPPEGEAETLRITTCWTSEEPIALEDNQGPLVLRPDIEVRGPKIAIPSQEDVYAYASAYGMEALWDLLSPYNGDLPLPEEAVAELDQAPDMSEEVDGIVKTRISDRLTPDPDLVVTVAQ